MPKRTYQPRKSHRKKLGFLTRMATKWGRDMIKRRRKKGRKVLDPHSEMKKRQGTKRQKNK